MHYTIKPFLMLSDISNLFLKLKFFLFNLSYYESVQFRLVLKSGQQSWKSRCLSFSRGRIFKSDFSKWAQKMCFNQKWWNTEIWTKTNSAIWYKIFPDIWQNNHFLKWFYKSIIFLEMLIYPDIWAKNEKSLAIFLLNFQLFIKLVTIMRFKSNMRRFVRWRVPNEMPTS